MLRIPSILKPGTSLHSTASRTSSPMRGKMSDTPDSGLLLSVAILKARNLAAKDRGGTSDPYLVLSLGDGKHSTAAIPKTLNPEWNEQCQLPIHGVASLILDVLCWDKDRFSKDYLGEFDLALEEIFGADQKTEQPPKWYPLKSKRPGKKTGVVSGEVQLQFTLLDAADPNATDAQILGKFDAFVKAKSPETAAAAASASATVTSATSATVSAPAGARSNTDDDNDDNDDNDDDDDDDEDPSKPDTVEKRKRRLRIKGLRKKKRENPYEFVNGGDNVMGIVFLEIKGITDLPPESNFTKTSFDMDPFVIASLGRKTYRTRKIRHNLNPVFDEKLIFQALSHEQSYSFQFNVVDHDKYSGNDFIASASLPLQEFIDRAPKADPETGLYDLGEVPEYVPAAQRGRFKRLGLSRTPSMQSLSKMARAGSAKASPAATTTTTATTATTPSTQSASASSATAPPGFPLPEMAALSVADAGSVDPAAVPTSAPSVPVVAEPETLAASTLAVPASVPTSAVAGSEPEDQGFSTFTLPLKMKNLDKWEDKHNPQLCIRAKYMPYPALRQQFWRAMLRQYDTDESGRISKVELSTMLDTLGSTLRESTIDSFFQRFRHRTNSTNTNSTGTGSDDMPDGMSDLTVDEAVICLEDQLDAKDKTGLVDRLKEAASALPTIAKTDGDEGPSPASAGTSAGSADGDDDLNDRGEEHVVEIRECPICHQPRLNKRKDADIITHIATCASQDWRQVNSLVMGGFVTASQAQRKWYSKVITKISYGGYKIGANSANILVQDRITGQISEEKMSVYVRMGIRLLYKGLRSNNMENRRIQKMLKSLSLKQGRKYDDPASKQDIQKFIDFHQLDLSEVLLPLDAFKNFNEFFYRALKPGARPCSAPENPHIIVSPADCRSVVFNRVSAATQVWIKGRGFTVKRLLGDGASAEEAARYENGALGIFRLAPQDYHRFHIPVDGVLGRPHQIAGEYYTVNPMAIRSALDVYGENVRVVVPIDSSVHGRVQVVCVGAMMVGSTVITRREGEHVQRGEELGYFKFGGSTLVLLFEDGAIKFDDDLVDNSAGALETLIRVGMSVGHSPHEPQWKPDMPKAQTDITTADLREAKRRIEGSGSGAGEAVPVSAEQTETDSGGE